LRFAGVDVGKRRGSLVRLLWFAHRRMVRKGRPPLRVAQLAGAFVLLVACLTAVLSAPPPAISWLLATAGVLAVLIPTWLGASIFAAAPDNPYLAMLTTGDIDMAPIDQAAVAARIDEVWTSRLGSSAAAAYRECMVVLSRIVMHNTVALTSASFGVWLSAIPLGGAIRWTGIAVSLSSLMLSFLRYRPQCPHAATQVAAAWENIALALGWSTITSTPPASPVRFQEWLEEQQAVQPTSP